MYNEKVMERFANPKNAGVVINADGKGKVGNMKCGDIMSISLKIDNGTITDAKFKTFGCVSAIAASDMACELIKGKSLEHAKKLTNKDIVDALGGLPDIKIHCSVLGKEAIDKAIKDYESKNSKTAKK